MSEDKKLVSGQWTITIEQKRRLRKEAIRQAERGSGRISESKVLRDIIDNSNLPK